MTAKRIVWLRPDGGISITVPCESMRPGEAEKKYLDRLAAAFQASHPDHAEYTRLPDVDVKDIPTDRTFRDAWTAGFQVDLAKARDICKKMLKDKIDKDVEVEWDIDKIADVGSLKKYLVLKKIK